MTDPIAVIIDSIMTPEDDLTFFEADNRLFELMGSLSIPGDIQTAAYAGWLKETSHMDEIFIPNMTRDEAEAVIYVAIQALKSRKDILQ